MTDTEDQPTLTKASHAQFVRTWTDEHLILHLTHCAEVWFKDADILALEELVRRFKDNAQLRRTFP